MPMVSADCPFIREAASGEGSADGLMPALTLSDSVTGSTLSGRAVSGLSDDDFKDISLLANGWDYWAIGAWTMRIGRA